MYDLTVIELLTEIAFANEQNQTFEVKMLSHIYSDWLTYF